MTNNQIKVFCPNLHIVENDVMLKLDSVASAVVLIGLHQRELVPEITFLVFLTLLVKKGPISSSHDDRYR